MKFEQCSLHPTHLWHSKRAHIMKHSRLIHIWVDDPYKLWKMCKKHIRKSVVEEDREYHSQMFNKNEPYTWETRSWTKWKPQASSRHLTKKQNNTKLEAILEHYIQTNYTTKKTADSRGYLTRISIRSTPVVWIPWIPTDIVKIKNGPRADQHQHCIPSRWFLMFSPMRYISKGYTYRPL